MTHTHWRTPAERKAFIQQHVVDEAREATNKEPDPDALIMAVGYYEDLAVKQEAVDHRRAEDAATERALEEAIAEEERAETKAWAQQHIGTDPRTSPTLNMHAAMGAPIYAAMPMIEAVVGLIPVLGQAVAVIEAVSGESLFTGEELSDGERALTLLMVAIPEAGTIVRSGARGAKLVMAIARQTKREASEVLKLLRGVARTSASDVATMRSAIAAAKTGRRLSAAERTIGQRLLEDLDQEHLALRGRGPGERQPHGPWKSAEEQQRVARAYGDDPVGHMQPRDSAREAGINAPARSTPTDEALAKEPGRTGDMYPKKWRERSDAKLLERHGIDIDKHELEYRHKLELATKEGAGDKVLGSLKSKITEAEGERAATQYMLEEEPGTVLQSGFSPGKGYDQVWARPGPKGGEPAEYIIVEAKGPEASLGSTSRKGDQMSPQWVTETARKMARSGDPVGIKIFNAIKKGHPPVTGRLIEADGVGGFINHELPMEHANYPYRKSPKE